LGGIHKLSQSDEIAEIVEQIHTGGGDKNKSIRYFEHKHLPGACVKIGLNTSTTLDPELAAE
jgi:hypothetical protein